MNKITRSSEETFQLGKELSKRLKKGDVVSVFGELGAGKTRIIQGICEGLQVQERVTSPSFTLINEYSGREKVYHFDFFRINKLTEAVDLGCDEYFYNDGICLIEWPEKIEKILPKKRIDIIIRYFKGKENWRRIKVQKNRRF